MNFDELVAQSEAARRRREEREARQRTIRQQRLQEIKQEMRGTDCDFRRPSLVPMLSGNETNAYLGLSDERDRNSCNNIA